MAEEEEEVVEAVVETTRDSKKWGEMLPEEVTIPKRGSKIFEWRTPPI